LLEVSPETFAEVRTEFKSAGYDHALHRDEGREIIDMYGIGLMQRSVVHEVVGVVEFKSLPLGSRARIVCEREVSAVSVTETEIGTPPVVLTGWYAVVDAEGNLVCLVPPGGAVDSSHRSIPDARVSVVVDVLNQATLKT
jgi:hypothetical protein